MKAYEVTYQEGILSIEQDLKHGFKECDLGIQIAEDGRIWVCVDGQALIRFRPNPIKKE